MRKEIIEATVFVIALTGLMAGGIGIGINIGKSEQIASEQPKNTGIPVIIWNDDEESMPNDGKIVEIQETINDTIYIGNVD
jgi:hypothetical protein